MSFSDRGINICVLEIQHAELNSGLEELVLVSRCEVQSFRKSYIERKSNKEYKGVHAFSDMGNKHNKRSRHAKATRRELREEAAQRREAEMEATEEQEQLRLQR